MYRFSWSADQDSLAVQFLDVHMCRFSWSADYDPHFVQMQGVVQQVNLWMCSWSTGSPCSLYNIWKRYVCPLVSWMVCRTVGWLVCHNFLNAREDTLPYSFMSWSELGGYWGCASAGPFVSIYLWSYFKHFVGKGFSVPKIIWWW